MMESKVYRLNENDIMIIKIALRIMINEAVSLKDKLSTDDLLNINELIAKVNDKLK